MIGQVVTALVFFVQPGVDPSSAGAAQAALKERLARGGELLDLSVEHRKLFTPSLFVDFTAPPPAFLPPDLAAGWKKGSEACAQHVGPTGPQLYPLQRARSASLAGICALAVGRATWPLLLQARHVKRVVSVKLTDGAGGFEVWATLSTPDGKGRLIHVEKVSPDRMAAAAIKAVEDLEAGRGEKDDEVDQAMPSMGAPGMLDAVAFGPPAPAQVPTSCKGLPARLEVFPPGKFTRAIESAYKTVPADKRTGPPLRCDLVAYPDDGGRDEGPLVRARLACPPSQARAGAKVAEAAKLVPWLVDDTVAALCWAQGTQ